VQLRRPAPRRQMNRRRYYHRVDFS
jgi:hypothetical protein